MKFIYSLYAQHLLLKGIHTGKMDLFQKALDLSHRHQLNISHMVNVDIGETYDFYSDPDAAVRRTRHVTPLLLASRLGRTEMLPILIEKGADLYHTDETSFNALEYALVGEHWDAALFLWNQGCQVFENHVCMDSTKSFALKKVEMSDGRWEDKLREEEIKAFQSHLQDTLNSPQETAPKMRKVL